VEFSAVTFLLSYVALFHQIPRHYPNNSNCSLILGQRSHKTVRISSNKDYLSCLLVFKADFVSILIVSNWISAAKLEADSRNF